jgi:hypothetical protein
MSSLHAQEAIAIDIADDEEGSDSLSDDESDLEEIYEATSAAFSGMYCVEVNEQPSAKKSKQHNMEGDKYSNQVHTKGDACCKPKKKKSIIHGKQMVCLHHVAFLMLTYC